MSRGSVGKVGSDAIGPRGLESAEDTTRHAALKETKKERISRGRLAVAGSSSRDQVKGGLHRIRHDVRADDSSHAEPSVPFGRGRVAHTVSSAMKHADSGFDPLDEIARDAERHGRADAYRRDRKMPNVTGLPDATVAALQARLEREGFGPHTYVIMGAVTSTRAKIRGVVVQHFIGNSDPRYPELRGLRYDADTKEFLAKAPATMIREFAEEAWKGSQWGLVQSYREQIGLK